MKLEVYNHEEDSAWLPEAEVNFFPYPGSKIERRETHKFLYWKINLTPATSYATQTAVGLILEEQKARSYIATGIMKRSLTEAVTVVSPVPKIGQAFDDEVTKDSPQLVSPSVKLWSL